MHETVQQTWICLYVSLTITVKVPTEHLKNIFILRVSTLNKYTQTHHYNLYDWRHSHLEAMFRDDKHHYS
jgi:hypothetical protein